MTIANIGEAIAKAALLGLWWTVILFVLVGLWAAIVETRRWRARKRKAAELRRRNLTVVDMNGRRHRA
jgi:membrane protein implicated in regulation of membrane protease activity